MSTREWKTSGIVLSRKPSGESHHWMRILTPERGPVSAMQRLAKKAGQARNPPADLFDSLELILEAPKAGGDDPLFFVKALEIDRRRQAIGARYPTLCRAVDYAGLLLKNTAHLEAYEALYAQVETVLDAFAEGKREDVVYFKGLFLFARAEGFPVKESWWAALAGARKAEVTRLLNRPADAVGLAREAVAPLAASLENWLTANTDVIV